MSQDAFAGLLIGTLVALSLTAICVFTLLEENTDMDGDALWFGTVLGAILFPLLWSVGLLWLLTKMPRALWTTSKAVWFAGTEFYGGFSDAVRARRPAKLPKAQVRK